MEISRKELRHIFGKLEVESTASKHHVTGFVPDELGRPLLPVYYSHGSKGLSGPPAHQFRKSLYLTPSEFADLIRCTFSRDDVLERARDVARPGRQTER